MILPELTSAKNESGVETPSSLVLTPQKRECVFLRGDFFATDTAENLTLGSS